MVEAGGLRLQLDLADGVVREATIGSSRPTGLARMFHGRGADEAPLLAGRLFTLCARAHGAASALAVAAARGCALSADALRREAVAVLAERVFETLRACAMDWPGAAPDRASAAALREAAASRAPDALRRAAEVFGLGGGGPDTVLGRILADCAAPALASPTLDPLTPADDAAVAAALLADPQGFGAAPSLPGRRPETGAFARVGSDGPPTLAARARARLLDLTRTLDEWEALASGGAAPGLIASGALGDHAGYGASETARGRLYHAVSCDEDGRILIYGMVAPTEWNFHAVGPFVATLRGARLGRAEDARLAAHRLVALIDPCCAFEIAVAET